MGNGLIAHTHVLFAYDMVNYSVYILYVKFHERLGPTPVVCIRVVIKCNIMQGCAWLII